MTPTETQLATMVRHDDPAAFRWFGALLEHSSYSPARRNVDQNTADATIKATWPKFAIAGASNDDVKRACLWDAVKKERGTHWTPFFQETGSCVGQGGGAAVNYLMGVEAWVKRDAEEVKWPTFLLYPYGRSRVYANLRGPGDGSFGSAFAQAIKDDGIFESDLSGLPKTTERNGGLTWGGSVETAWSWSPESSALYKTWSAEGHKNPVQTVAQAKRADDVSAGLRNGYSSTCASMWGGRMKCPVVEGVLLNERVDEWAHQMCCIGWQEHPKLGELFYILNSWGNPHGIDPDGGPPGGFWIRKADMEFMCRDEVFIFSNFDGFPAQELNWSDIMRW